MKTILLFIGLAVVFSTDAFAQKLKKVEVPVTKKQKTTVHVLDSILWSQSNGGNYEVIAKEVITGRVPGAEYLWSEKQNYLLDNNTNTMRLYLKTRQTYLNNSVDAPVEKYLTYPWNTNLNAWDDTMTFIHLTGDTNHILDFVVFTDYIEKSYDYINNKFVYGVRYKIMLLNDTCPSQQDILILDTVNYVFVPYQKLIISYDNNMLIDSAYIYSYNDVTQQFDLVSLILFTFNNYLITERVSKFWDGSQWANSQRELYTYDANGNEIEYLNQNWDFVLNDWKNAHKTEKTYNVNNLLLTESHFNWDETQNIWVPIFKTSLAYDALGNIIVKEYYNSDGTSFVPIQKFEYTYDANNNLINETRSSWDVNTSSYYYTFKEDRYYTANVLDSIYNYYYDNFLLEWILTNKTEYEYDSYQELVREENFMLIGNVWEPNYKTEYFYSNVNLFANTVPVVNSIGIYPNPSNQYLYLDFNRVKEVDAVKIYNKQGRLVKQFNKLSLFAPMDVTDLASGTYIIHVVSGNKEYQAKFIKH